MDESDLAQFKQEIREKAVRRVRAKLGFVWHAAIFLMANLTLVFINLRFNPSTLWFVWPLAGWGAGLFFHGFAVFQGQGLTEDMVEAEVQRELARRGIR